MSASLENLLTTVAGRYGLEVTELCSGSRRREVVKARGLVNYVAVRIGGLGPTKLGSLLRVSRQSILRGLKIGERLMINNKRELKSFWS